MEKAKIELAGGIMVRVDTYVRGGAEDSRETVEISPERDAPEGGAARAYKVNVVVADVEEKKRAFDVRSDASDRIAKCCAKTPFGLIAPIEREAELDVALREADDMVARFNATSRIYRIELWSFKARISGDEREVRKVASALADLIARMERGIAERDEASIREAADRALKIGSLLDGASAAKVSEAVKAARESAREIVKTIKKRGDAAIVLASDANRKLLEQARFAFLDDTAPATVEGETMAPAIARDVDDAVPAEVAAEVAVAVQVEPAPEAVPVVEAAPATVEAEPAPVEVPAIAPDRFSDL